MISEIDIRNWYRVKNLFESHLLFRSILNPCAQMGIGSLTVDNVDLPTVALYSTPLMVFVAGNAKSSSAQSMVKSLQPYVLFFTYDNDWKALLKSEWRNKLVIDIRTHLDHSTLSLEHLRNLKNNLEQEYTLKKLDFKAAKQIADNYSIPIRLYFGSIENLIEKGLGFCIMHGEKLVSIAYTAFPFIDEFEIQVFTADSTEYRRKGMATIVSAALLEYGLERGLVPHWDAANEASVKLALKLGYSNPKTWEAYYRKE